MRTEDEPVSRDVRMQRAAATLDKVDSSVVRALTAAKARVDQANETRATAVADRNRLVMELRAEGVSIGHIAYLLGISYDTVVLIVREAKQATS